MSAKTVAFTRWTDVLPHGAASGETTASPDALVVLLGPGQPAQALTTLPDALRHAAETYLSLDAAAHTQATLLPCAAAPGGRLILAPTGPLHRDHDDVRRVGDAAAAGVLRARDAGATRPCLVLAGVSSPNPDDDRFQHAMPVAALAGHAALWQPLEAREALGAEAVEPVTQLGFLIPGGSTPPATEAQVSFLASWVHAVESGRRWSRDLAGTQPERMTPIRFAMSCETVLAHTTVDVHIEDDLNVLRADYPLLHAVSRASLGIERHHPRVVRLTWQGAGPVERTLFFSGKGVTYDTGGADLKTDGHMAGMSRDKGGAAAVAGLFLTATLLPEALTAGTRMVAELGLVRNDIGPDSFVTDEILVSHAGIRVRVGNTDAEGRLVMADLLSHLRHAAHGVPDPHLFTVATLTGHAGIAMGPYTISMDNGPARARRISQQMAHTAGLWGEPIEVSRLRREDWDMVRPRTKADDVLSSNNAPSSRTPRGHQFPMAFLAMASGLHEHGLHSAHPLPYTHIDVGGSGVADMDWQHGSPTATPLVALATTWLRGLDTPPRR